MPVLLVLQEAREPRVVGAVAHLGRAGLAAYGQAREAVIAVDLDHVVAHQALHGLGGLGVYQHGLLGGLAVVDELGLNQHAVVCDGGDEAQHRVGADQVGRLPRMLI